MADQSYEPDADLAALHEHPDNPRRGDDQSVADSIDVNGFYGAILVQRSTGRVLAGHTRRRVLLAKGISTGPVIRLDCDDETARRILLADNRTAELAAWDDVALASLLSDLAAEGTDALAGTGFDQDQLQALLDDLALDGGTPPAADTDDQRADRLHRYENTAMRQVVLLLARDEYEPLIEGLEVLRDRWQLPSYAQVVQRLVADANATSDVG